MTIQDAIKDNEKCENIKLKSYSTGQEMTIKENGELKVTIKNLPIRRTITTTRVGNEICTIEYKDEQ